jgi:sterol desaturase/sphingolipid hydroxylase (fatty acid hydroxylase superfamily)
MFLLIKNGKGLNMSPKISKWASIGVFPFVMCSVLAAQLFCMHLGFNPAISAVAVSLTGLVLIALLERVLPYRADWNTSDGDVKTDALHVLITQIILPKTLELVWPLLFLGIAGSLSTLLGPQNLWPHEWPILAQLLLMLLIAEFGRYWVHRAAHEVSFLWKFHAVHHSPNRLYFFNAARFHPLEKIYFLIPEVVPFILLGTNIECLAIYAVFNSIHGLMQHSNIRVNGGWLNYVFSLTELHRWHHSQPIEESNTNYGNNLICWDIVFGTFFWPKDREVPTIGLLNRNYPKSYIGQLKAPFSSEDLTKPADYHHNKNLQGIAK